MKEPIFRFKGYTDDWEQRKLGEFFSERSERANGDEELLSVTIANGVIRQIESDKRNTASEDKSNYKIVKKGDVPYNSMRMWQGAVGTSAYDGIVSPAYTVLTPKSNANGKFFMELFKKEPTLEIFKRWSQGLTSDTWNLKFPALSTIVFAAPSIDEQAKIADYFTSIDNLIALNQRKCDTLKELKKGMLQKMFPKDGEKVPEFRFKGFTGDWERRRLGDVIEDYVEKTTIEDQYPVLTSSQQKGIVLQDEYFSGERASQTGNIGYFVIPRGYFAYRSRSDNDVFVFNRNDAIDIGIISYFYPVFKPSGVDSDFLLRRLNHGLDAQIKINSEGTGQHVLSLKKFKNIVGLFPSNEEQKLIGRYFKDLDNIIVLQQRKCDALKDLKKGLLQKMFI